MLRLVVHIVTTWLYRIGTFCLYHEMAGILLSIVCFPFREQNGRVVRATDLQVMHKCTLYPPYVINKHSAELL